MSCGHGNPVDDCEECKILDGEYLERVWQETYRLRTAIRSQAND